MKRWIMIAATLIVAIVACQKNKTADPYILIDVASGCKGAPLKAEHDNSTSEDCIYYEYDGDSVLRIRHINAAFNCCPGLISVDLNWTGDTLYVVESERESLCDCDCLYDLEYSIFGISEGSVTISIYEPYVRDEKQLVFTVNLKKSPTGSYCEERHYYPWGL